MGRMPIREQRMDPVFIIIRTTFFLIFPVVTMEAPSCAALSALLAVTPPPSSLSYLSPACTIGL